MAPGKSLSMAGDGPKDAEPEEAERASRVDRAVALRYDRRLS
jgi:hypothetical protein